jgi:hypothetical protein
MGTGGKGAFGVKPPGREADHSPPSSVQVKNAWNYNSIPPIRLQGWCLVKHRTSRFLNTMIMESEGSPVTETTTTHVHTAVPFSTAFKIYEWQHLTNLGIQFAMSEHPTHRSGHSGHSLLLFFPFCAYYWMILQELRTIIKTRCTNDDTVQTVAT